MAEIGQVTRKMNDEVEVRLLRQEACAKCGACSAGLDAKDMFIEAMNLCQADENDWVEIQLEEANFIKAVGIMYGIPMFGLILGLAVGAMVTTSFMNQSNDIVIGLFGLIGAGLGFLGIRLNESKFKTKKYKPVAIKKVENYSCGS